MTGYRLHTIIDAKGKRGCFRPLIHMSLRVPSRMNLASKSCQQHQGTWRVGTRMDLNKVSSGDCHCSSQGRAAQSHDWASLSEGDLKEGRESVLVNHLKMLAFYFRQIIANLASSCGEPCAMARTSELYKILSLPHGRGGMCTHKLKLEVRNKRYMPIF